MIDAIVRAAIRLRIAVLWGTAVVLVIGFMIARGLPIDAVPDITNVQVQVLTDSPGLSAEEVERYVTLPVEMGLNGLPNLQEIRSVTRAGLSAITIVFDDEVDVWFARQLVSERLRSIEADVPAQFGRPELAPVSTGLGEIYQFVLRSDRHSAMELRTMLEWDVAPRLRSVPGVIEVNVAKRCKKLAENNARQRYLSSAEISALLARFGQAAACWFSSVRPDGRPHLAPIWHVVHEDRIYVVTQRKAVRAANISQQPHVSLALPDPMNVLVIEGVARPAPERREALRPLFQAKFNWDIATDADYDTVIEVTPRKVMAWGSHGEGRWLLHGGDGDDQRGQPHGV